MARAGDEGIEVRRAGPEDAATVGRMLDEFNREFAEPTPGPGLLAERIGELMAAEGLVAFLAGSGPDGFAILRIRPNLYSRSNEAYLAELYVTPEMRGRGLGRALLEASLDAAREAGCDRIELGTGESDTAARALYERLGFRNTEGGAEGPTRMLFYEREL